MRRVATHVLFMAANDNVGTQRGLRRRKSNEASIPLHPLPAWALRIMHAPWLVCSADSGREERSVTSGLKCPLKTMFTI